MHNKGMVLLFFDLPMREKKDTSAYRKFKKGIKKLGYFSIQESVYVKLMRNIKNYCGEIEALKRVIPNKGNVAVMSMTESEFRKIVFLIGTPFDKGFLCDDIISL